MNSAKGTIVTTITITTRPYIGETDLAPVADFLNLVEAHDRIEEGTSVAELREEFGEPGFEPERDLRLYEDEMGQLVGFAQLWAVEDTDDNDGFLWFKVHPQHRGGELEAQMFAWAEERLRERGRVKLRVVAREVETAKQALYERHGFEPVRYFLRMRRDLALPIPAPVFPAGYTLRDGDHDPQLWAELYNESFVDHYNFHPHDAAWVQHWQQEPSNRPELSLVAVAPDGTLAAFAWCSVHVEENQRTGRLDGHIGLLGTRRGHRRIGLGRAMLLAGMQRLREAGMSHAMLGVDASSPTGANTLYESAGFETFFTRILYSRDVP
jgi:mycothiol synthase